MNDRYFFRGKCKDNGAWMQGSLIAFPDDNEHYGIWSENAQSYLWIYPATVGQCTGLKDKSGKLIFEGDIVLSGSYGKPEAISFGVNIGGAGCGCGVNHYIGYVGFSLQDDYSEHEWRVVEEFSKYEVIGNIHDNPELLEGGDGA